MARELYSLSAFAVVSRAAHVPVRAKFVFGYVQHCQGWSDTGASTQTVIDGCAAV